MDSMKKANISPVTRTYEALISCAEKCGKWEEAIDLLREMKVEGILRTTNIYNSAMWAADRYTCQFIIFIIITIVAAVVFVFDFVFVVIIATEIMINTVFYLNY